MLNFVSDTPTPTEHMCSSICSSSFEFAPQLVHQKSLTMDKKKSLQNVLSAKHLVATHEVTDCRSEAVLQKYLLRDFPQKKQYKVWIHS